MSYFYVFKVNKSKLETIWISQIYILILLSSWLIFQGHLYIIDVSQSVDLDHPLALNFLREDCDHVSVSAGLV